MVLQLTPTSRSLKIDTDDERVRSYVRAAYSHTLSEGPATDAAAFFTEPDSAAVTFNGEPLPRAWPAGRKNPWESHVYIVDQFVWRTLARDADWLALYACALVINGRAVLLAGESGVGKTTLALALQRLGARVLGDEMALIHRRDFTVDAVDRALSVRSGTEDALDDPVMNAVIRKRAAVVGDAENAFFAVDRRTFGNAARPAKLAATFVVTRGSEPRIAAVSPSRAALRIAPYAVRRPSGLDDVVGLADVLGAGRCFSLELADPNASARAVIAALATC
jgi:hypothetical protein